jgi:hypothetical protein
MAQQVVLGETLRDAPSDGITRVRFSAISNLLLASSWDSVSGSQALLVHPLPSAALRSYRCIAPRTAIAPQPSSWLRQGVRVYEASAPGGSLRGVLTHVAPVLDCAFGDDTVAYAGCLDGVCTRCVGPPWSRPRLTCAAPPHLLS